MIAAVGMALALLGAVLLYLASPNQRATAGRLAGRPLAVTGSALLVASLVVLLQWAGAATAVFIVLTLACLVWTLVPPLAAWLRQPQEPAR